MHSPPLLKEHPVGTKTEQTLEIRGSVSGFVLLEIRRYQQTLL